MDFSKCLVRDYPKSSSQNSTRGRIPPGVPSKNFSRGISQAAFKDFFRNFFTIQENTRRVLPGISPVIPIKIPKDSDRDSSRSPYKNFFKMFTDIQQRISSGILFQIKISPRIYSRICIPCLLHGLFQLFLTRVFHTDCFRKSYIKFASRLLKQFLQKFLLGLFKKFQHGNLPGFLQRFLLGIFLGSLQVILQRFYSWFLVGFLQLSILRFLQECLQKFIPRFLKGFLPVVCFHSFFQGLFLGTFSSIESFFKAFLQRCSYISQTFSP